MFFCRSRNSSRLQKMAAILLAMSITLAAGCSSSREADNKDDESNKGSTAGDTKSNADSSSGGKEQLKGGSERMAQNGQTTSIDYLPAGTNPLAEKEAPEADSGEKGTLYYINSSAMLQRLGSDTKAQYDTLKFAASLQGLLNREKPTLFIDFIKDTDQFWYSYLRKKDNLLYGYKKETIDNMDDVLKIFADTIQKQGIILWDPDVPSTANVAATICSVDGYLPVRYDEEKGSLHQILVNTYKVPVKMDLRGKFSGKGTIPDIGRKSSGSAKCDAYLWALDKYLDRTNELVMGYVLDGASWSKDKVEYPDLNNAFVPNHDYLVAKKAFVFDLSPWNDEAPCDDPNQPLGTDYNTLKEILQCQYDRTRGKKIIQVSGFVPWQIKYTTWQNKSRHEPVPTEWKYAEILSAYNCVMDADAAGYCGLSNASLYMHYPLKDKYTNNRPKNIPKYDSSKRYVYIYMGDYDAAPWLARFAPKVWNDPMRGKVPFAWAFNPNLSDRIPMVFDYLYETKTENDFFIAGDSGAGYLNPTLLLPPRLHSDNPSGMDAWIEHNQYYYDKFDLGITGFIINGVHPTPEPVLEAYTKFSQDGVVSNTLDDTALIFKRTAFKKMNADIAHGDNSVVEAADMILKNAGASRLAGPKFYAFRTILCTPTFINAVINKVKAESPSIEFVDPYTYFELMKQAYEAEK